MLCYMGQAISHGNSCLSQSSKKPKGAGGKYDTEALISQDEADE